jgi:hypothetical protein
MISVDCKRQHDWLELVVAAMQISGCAIVENVPDGDFRSRYEQQ